jgi:hypothetical protein
MWNECPSECDVIRSTQKTNMISWPRASEKHRILAIREIAEEVCISGSYYNQMFGKESRKHFTSI